MRKTNKKRLFLLDYFLDFRTIYKSEIHKHNVMRYFFSFFRIMFRLFSNHFRFFHFFSPLFSSLFSSLLFFILFFSFLLFSLLFFTSLLFSPFFFLFSFFNLNMKKIEKLHYKNLQNKKISDYFHLILNMFCSFFLT